MRNLAYQKAGNMTIFKQGEMASSEIVPLSYTYICDYCGFVKTSKEDIENKCDHCDNGKMVLTEKDAKIKDAKKNNG